MQNKESGLCYTSWINDRWCDISCNVQSCDFDSYKCDQCGGSCATAFYYLILHFANTEYPVELITVDEGCQYWNILLGLNLELEDLGGNCSTVFDMLDLNGNGFIGMHEAIAATAETWGLTSDDHWQMKLQQTDCSRCLENASLYYW